MSAILETIFYQRRQNSNKLGCDKCKTVSMHEAPPNHREEAINFAYKGEQAPQKKSYSLHLEGAWVFIKVFHYISFLRN